MTDRAPGPAARISLVRLSFLWRATCAAVCMGGSAFSQVLDDLTVTWASDGACHIMTIRNQLTAAPQMAVYTLSDPVSVQLTVLHDWPKGPETVFARVPPGWIVWPEQIEIADHDTGAMSICPEVGA